MFLNIRRIAVARAGRAGELRGGVVRQVAGVDDHRPGFEADRHVVGPVLVVLHKLSGEVEVSFFEPGRHVGRERVQIMAACVLEDEPVGVLLGDDESLALGRDLFARVRQIGPAAARRTTSFGGVDGCRTGGARSGCPRVGRRGRAGIGTRDISSTKNEVFPLAVAASEADAQAHLVDVGERQAELEGVGLPRGRTFPCGRIPRCRMTRSRRSCSMSG